MNRLKIIDPEENLVHKFNKARWVLRIAVAGEFLGHGVFALGGKKAWIEWFSVFGISDLQTATMLLWLIGLMDVVLALLILIKPIRLALLWMAL